MLEQDGLNLEGCKD